MNTIETKICYTGIKLWLKRLQSKSPAFFVRIQNAATVVASLWAVIIALDATGFFAFMPATTHAHFVVIVTAIGSLLTGAGFVAKLPSTDPNLVGDDLKAAILHEAVAKGTVVATSTALQNKNKGNNPTDPTPNSVV